jgi:hypothetical protein
MSRGYVYILEVADIDLPVCKIGRTSKAPAERCAEINRSSTGDFLWQVAYEIAVSDCKVFERLVHKKLDPLRQKNREFFNVTADVAYTAVRSILAGQSMISELTPQELGERRGQEAEAAVSRKPRKHRFTKRDSDYADILALFTRLTKCKGRPFGQLNKPYFGISDGNEGVQWNFAVYTEHEQYQLGVNLEGKKYGDWPIRSFILTELEHPRFIAMRDALIEADRIHMRLTRDAWQVTARPSIVEKHIGRENIRLTGIDLNTWQSMLTEALECLDEDRDYRGRAKQLVTLRNEPKAGPRARIMEVSPHLTFWTSIERQGDMERRIAAGIERLTPIYEWVAKAVQS